jgi:sugar/nucleoside kinase (ribokinase family)
MASAFRIHGTGHAFADLTLTGTDKGALCDAGGSGLVAMAVASQLLKPAKIPVTYYGLSGDDVPASRLRHLLAQTPLDMTCFRQRQGRTPSAAIVEDAPDVRHDPGTVSCDASVLGESFTQAAINVYAGTSMLELHAVLPALLAKGRHRGAINVVAPGSLSYNGKSSTEKSFTEKKSPTGLQGLIEGEAYPHIDLLVSDADGIRALAGRLDAEDAGRSAGVEESVSALFRCGLTAAVVALEDGSVYYRSMGGVFGRTEGRAPAFAAVAAVADRVAGSISPLRNSGDTSGAEGNFLAGMLADMMLQILSDDFYPKGELHVEKELLQICPLRLRHAIEFGVVAEGVSRLRNRSLEPEASKGELLKRVRTFFPDTVPAGRPW